MLVRISPRVMQANAFFVNDSACTYPTIPSGSNFATWFFSPRCTLCKGPFIFYGREGEAGGIWEIVSVAYDDPPHPDMFLLPLLPRKPKIL